MLRHGLFPAPARSRILRFAATLAVLSIPSGLAAAAVLSGSLRTTVYSQESRAGAGSWEVRVDESGGPLDDENRSPLENRTSVYERVRLSVTGLGTSSLSFHTNFTGSNILTHQSIGDSRFRFYRGYLQYASRPGARVGFDARAGRQWVNGGVGTGIIDGVSLRLARVAFGEATGFFGTLGSDRLGTTDRLWSLDSPDDSRTYGGRLRLQHPLGAIEPRLAFSWARADRSPHAKLVRDEERMGVHGELRLSRGAARANPILGGLRLYGDWKRDLIWNRDIAAAGGLEYVGRPHDLRARVEYQQRRPYLKASSYFASFGSKPVDELRAGCGAKVWRAIRVDLDANLFSFAGDENDTGVSLVVSGRDLALGYRFQDGWGGDLSGIFLSAHRRIGARLTVEASVDFSKYTYGAVEGEPGIREIDDDATAAIVALGYDILPRLTATGQVEILENATYNHDVRLLGMVHWRFRTAF